MFRLRSWSSWNIDGGDKITAKYKELDSFGKVPAVSFPFPHNRLPRNTLRTFNPLPKLHTRSVSDVDIIAECHLKK